MKLGSQVLSILREIRRLLVGLILDGKHHQITIDIKRSKTKIIVSHPSEVWDSTKEKKDE